MYNFIVSFYANDDVQKEKKENSVSGINYYWTLFVRIRVLLKELIHEITVEYAFGLNLIL